MTELFLRSSKKFAEKNWCEKSHENQNSNNVASSWTNFDFCSFLVSKSPIKFRKYTCKNITKKCKTRKKFNKVFSNDYTLQKIHMPYAYELIPIFASKTQSTVSTPPSTLEYRFFLKCGHYGEYTFVLIFWNCSVWILQASWTDANFFASWMDSIILTPLFQLYGKMHLFWYLGLISIWMFEAVCFLNWRTSDPESRIEPMLCGYISPNVMYKPFSYSSPQPPFAGKMWTREENWKKETVLPPPFFHLHALPPSLISPPKTLWENQWQKIFIFFGFGFGFDSVCVHPLPLCLPPSPFLSQTSGHEHLVLFFFLSLYIYINNKNICAHGQKPEKERVREGWGQRGREVCTGGRRKKGIKGKYAIKLNLWAAIGCSRSQNDHLHTLFPYHSL